MLRAIIRMVLVLLLLVWILPTVSVVNWVTLLLAAVVLTILYGVVKPVLKLLFLPINVITLGLFAGLLNIFLLWLATYLVPGFTIQPMILLGLELNYFWTLVVISAVMGFIHPLVRKVI